MKNINEEEFNSSAIKNLLGTDVASLINEFTDNKPPTSLKTMYSGKVEDNNDPNQKGRCRIRVYGVHSDLIPSSDLPWAIPDMQFIGSTLGSFIVPPIDAIVQVYFEKGDIYNPKFTTKVLTENLPNDIAEDYPDTMVFFETDEGESFKINRKSGKTIYRHSSGTIFTVSLDGGIEISTDPSDTGNLIINVKGDAEVMATNLTVGTTGFASVVTPVSPTEGGAFCALPSCLFTGAPHQGKKVTNCTTLGGLEAN
jgi:hypothetical protein